MGGGITKDSNASDEWSEIVNKSQTMLGVFHSRWYLYLVNLHMIKYPIIPVAQTLILSCLKFDFFDVVISPGSRNVPLAIGFASNKKFKCYSIVDERSAAFFALGLSQKSKKPTILICTSGSALLNYYPAVAEAYYSEIPLIILSADRPEYKINIGDGQTINQSNVFEKNILYSNSLKQDCSHATEEIIKSNLQKIVNDKSDF